MRKILPRNAAEVPLLRLAAQTVMLEAEALAEATGEQVHLTRAAIAVNADSTSTRFTTVFADLPEALFDIRIEDQDHCAQLPREGVVMGAVSIERTPVPDMARRPHSAIRSRCRLAGGPQTQLKNTWGPAR